MKLNFIKTRLRPMNKKGKAEIEGLNDDMRGVLGLGILIILAIFILSKFGNSFTDASLEDNMTNLTQWEISQVIGYFGLIIAIIIISYVWGRWKKSGI